MRLRHSFAAVAGLCAVIASEIALAGPPGRAPGGAGAAPAPAGLTTAGAAGAAAAAHPVSIAGSPWEAIGGCAKRIGIGEAEHPFVTGCGASDDTQLFRLNASRVFEPIPGAAESVSPFLGGNGAGLAVTSRHQIFAVGNGQPALDEGNACVKEHG